MKKASHPALVPDGGIGRRASSGASSRKGVEVDPLSGTTFPAFSLEDSRKTRRLYRALRDTGTASVLQPRDRCAQDDKT